MRNLHDIGGCCLLLVVLCCTDKGEAPEHTNALIDENSPYLLQHAHNPVDWYPWGETALEKARKENKLLIVSIGYAACHWCHVMEKETFEDKEIAEFMNANFVAIKVDREERPDIDQIYMNAVQLLTGNGGWPLNCIALPDGRPIYGGTYFPKERWRELLGRIKDFVAQNPEKAQQQAALLTEGIQADELSYAVTENTGFTAADLDSVFTTWAATIDYTYGGHTRTPKFPMPVGYQFLLQYHYLTRDTTALRAVSTTLHKMASGGIYDQLGGGFARYATDKYWRVPHFEKMLYDNAQLVSLYAVAFQYTKDPVYKGVVAQTLDFIERELTDKTGGFYTSLDADSQGEEGKFYVWSQREIQEILGDRATLFMDYYTITEAGNWENGKNILYRTTTDAEIAALYGITKAAVNARVAAAKEVLFKARNSRVRPGLDDKILTSWNALMIKAYVDAYRVFGEERYLKSALKNARFLLREMKATDSYGLFRNYKNGNAAISGFLDDYAFTISAFIDLYQATFDEQWLREAQQFTGYTMTHFYDPQRGMFYYTSDKDPALIARKIAVTDHVMPSANSEMAKNLFALSLYFDRKDYREKSERMLRIVKKNTLSDGASYANWCTLMTWFIKEPYEVAIVGDAYASIRKALDEHYLPHVFLSGGKDTGTLAILKNKRVPGQTMIYVCRNKTCKYPVTEVKEALQQLN